MGGGLHIFYSKYRRLYKNHPQLLEVYHQQLGQLFPFFLRYYQESCSSERWKKRNAEIIKQNIVSLNKDALEDLKWWLGAIPNARNNINTLR